MERGRRAELNLIWDTIQEDLIDKLIAMGLPDQYPLEEIKKGIEKLEELV